jgi:hypothetical protein
MALVRFNATPIELDVPLEEVTRLFEPYGSVIEVGYQIYHNTQTTRPMVYVSLEIEEAVIMRALNELNGMIFDGQPLFVSTNKVLGPLPPMTNEVKKMVADLAKILDETEPQPRTQLRRLLQLCGERFVELVLLQTEAVEAEGGLLIKDGSRRRTMGGVFFYLARQKMAARLQRSVFHISKPGSEEAKKGKPQSAKGKSSAKPASDAAAKPPSGVLPVKPKQPQKPTPPPPQGKPKKSERAKQTQPIKPLKPLPPMKPIVAAPVSDPVALANARVELDELRAAYAAAQQQMEALKTLPANERKSGLFSATREVVNLQKQIAALTKQFPELND